MQPGGGPIMPNYDYDRDTYDYGDDERFYKETAYNEAYYIEQEQDLIRQSNLDLELEELEERHIQEMRKEGFSHPLPINHGENAPEFEKESPPDQLDYDFPF
jgi:hypothetical protein